MYIIYIALMQLYTLFSVFFPQAGDKNNLERSK
jgi:hypothetical protein